MLAKPVGINNEVYRLIIQNKVLGFEYRERLKSLWITQAVHSFETWQYGAPGCRCRTKKRQQELLPGIKDP
jgi:hypothetical protein